MQPEITFPPSWDQCDLSKTLVALFLQHALRNDMNLVFFDRPEDVDEVVTMMCQYLNANNIHTAWSLSGKQLTVHARRTRYCLNESQIVRSIYI